MHSAHVLRIPFANEHYALNCACGRIASKILDPVSIFIVGLTHYGAYYTMRQRMFV